MRTIGVAERALEKMCTRLLTRTAFGKRVAELAGAESDKAPGTFKTIKYDAYVAANPLPTGGAKIGVLTIAGPADKVAEAELRELGRRGHRIEEPRDGVRREGRLLVGDCEGREAGMATLDAEQTFSHLQQTSFRQVIPLCRQGACRRPA